jgi:hypothetical protein
VAKQYEVVIGIDHRNGRQEPGEAYKGPADAGTIADLLELGAIKAKTAAASSSSSAQASDDGGEG